jgi:hypothetical protein
MLSTFRANELSVHSGYTTDYPHADGFPDAPNMIKRMGLPPHSLANVLAGGAKRYYGLQ